MSLVPITKKELSLQIIFVETLGFALMVIVIWAEELFDIPHYLFGAQKTPINLTEAVFDSTILFILAIAVLYTTFRLLKRIRHLEGLVHVCSFCKKIQVDDDWYQIEDYISTHSAALFSHTVCPTCASKHYGDFIHKKE